MTKFALIFLLSLSSTAIWAETQLEPYIELTNLKTNDYVWKMQLTKDDNSSKLNIKLLNPNPKFPQLNQRAIEIAQKYYQRPSKLIPLDAPFTLAEDGRTRLYTKPYVFDIQFKSSIESSKILRTRPHLNKLSLKEARDQDEISINGDTVQILFELTADIDGKIPTQNIKILESSHNEKQIKELIAYTTDLLSQATLLTANKNGKAISIQPAKQEIVIKCPKQQKSIFSKLFSW